MWHVTLANPRNVSGVSCGMLTLASPRNVSAVSCGTVTLASPRKVSAVSCGTVTLASPRKVSGVSSGMVNNALPRYLRGWLGVKKQESISQSVLSLTKTSHCWCTLRNVLCRQDREGPTH